MRSNTAAREFTDIPAHFLPAKPGKLSFFETMALAGLEGKWIRLSAEMQRATLGRNVFGMQAIRVNNDGTVTVRRKTCFGTDYEQDTYEAAKIEQALLAGLKLSPGTYGGRYL